MKPTGLKTGIKYWLGQYDVTTMNRLLYKSQNALIRYSNELFHLRRLCFHEQRYCCNGVTKSQFLQEHLIYQTLATHALTKNGSM